MISPYILRLACLSLASFFLIHAAIGLALWTFSPSVLRLLRKTKPRTAARLLYVLRLFPAALSSVVVVGLCIPSYLWLEPNTSQEQVGIPCVIAAFLAVVIGAVSIARGLVAVLHSVVYARHCQSHGQPSSLEGEPLPVSILEQKAPLIALAGVFRPRLLISSSVLHGLSDEQLDVTLRHEHAHQASRDNLKRLLFLLMPEVFPFSRAFAALEQGWARLSEWAADDEATAGEANLSLTLAEALVRVARMADSRVAQPALSSLFADGQDIAARVQRLLDSDPPIQETELLNLHALVSGAILLSAGAIGIVALMPGTFLTVHRLLEGLIR